MTEYTSTVGTCTAPCWGTSYIYLDGALVAEYKNGTTYFVHKDHLGSTRLLTKLDRTLQDSMDYLPYGEQIAGSTGTTHKFTGKERDGESNLDYFGARYYSSAMGRFMSPDWAGAPTGVPYAEFGDPQSLNLYSYVRNSPIARIDADGHNYAGWNGAYADTTGGLGLPQDNTMDLEDALAGALWPEAYGETGGSASQRQQQQQPKAPINVSISVSQEPQMVNNLKIGDQYATGVAVQFRIVYSDSTGKPLAGASVKESNTVNSSTGGKTLLENPAPFTLRSKGSATNWFGAFRFSSTPITFTPAFAFSDLKSYTHSKPITLKGTTIDTVTTGKGTYTVSWTRTLTNIGTDGKLNTHFNSHGMNFTVTWTSLVITRIK